MEKIKFFPHQEAALKATEGMNRVAYFHDMGLGKTFTGAEKAMQMGNKTILVICQKSKVDDWINHFKTYYDKQVFDLTKPKQLREFQGYSIGEKYTVVGVINYDLAWRRKILLTLHNFTMMLDESSLIQNTSSKRTKFILALDPASVILLSGTPTSGKYERLWSQAHLLGWPISEKVYDTQYVNYKLIEIGGFKHKIVNPDDPYKNIERLKQKFRDHGACFLKTEDVFDLPDQTFIPVKVPVTKEYKKFKKDCLIDIDLVNLHEFKDDSDFYGNDMTPHLLLVGDSLLSKRLYMKQLCTAYNPNKIKAVKDLIESTQDRLIIFYCYNCELDQLLMACHSLERPVSVVNGKQKDLSAYENIPNSVTLIQYQAGAMGLNLQKANKIVYFSLTESVDLWMQSQKRIHRIGQNRPCFYYVMTCTGSIEERIMNALNRGVDYTDELFREEEKQ